MDKGDFQLPTAPQAIDFPKNIEKAPELLIDESSDEEMNEDLAIAEADINNPDQKLVDELNQIFADIGSEELEPPKKVTLPKTTKKVRKTITRNNPENDFLDEAADIFAEHKITIDQSDNLPLMEIPDKITAGAIIDKSQIYQSFSSSKIKKDKMNRSAPIYKGSGTKKLEAKQQKLAVENIEKGEFDNIPDSHEIEFVAGSSPILRKIEKIEAKPEVQLQTRADLAPSPTISHPSEPQIAHKETNTNINFASQNVGAQKAKIQTTTDSSVQAQADPKKTTSALTKKPQKKMDPELAKFVGNELIFILLEDDNVILGKQTEASKLDQMSFGEYTRHFERINREELRIPKARKMESFIAKYQKRPKQKMSKRKLLTMVTKAIDDGDLEELRVLDDNYNIIHLEDVDDSNMLHMATYKNKPHIAKWLVMRGVDIDAINEELMAPIDIAALKSRIDIFNLLKKAGAR